MAAAGILALVWMGNAGWGVWSLTFIAVLVVLLFAKFILGMKA
jgi:hypothetical protein